MAIDLDSNKRKKVTLILKILKLLGDRLLVLLNPLKLIRFLASAKYKPFDGILEE